MVMNKVGLNLNALENLSAPNISIGGTGEEIANNLSTSANIQTYNYWGLGVMITLFFYLVYKLGRGTELINEQFSSLRSIGISAGVVSIISLFMINLGFFSEYYHVVVFIGIFLLMWLSVFIGKRL